jgi:hypothetical protein
LCSILAAVQHDAADMSRSTGAGCFGNRLAVLPAVETFNLPQIRLDAGCLQPKRPGSRTGASLVGLPPVHGAAAFRVVAHQHLAEGRGEGLDVVRKVIAVLEVELVLPALLRRTDRGNAVGDGIAPDRGAELLAGQDAGLFGRRARNQRRTGSRRR